MFKFKTVGALNLVDLFKLTVIQSKNGGIKAKLNSIIWNYFETN